MGSSSDHFLASPHIELLGATTGFWVFANGLFRPSCTVNWDWVNNVILDPWNDKVLKYGDKVRKGNHEHYAKCLAMATLIKEPKIFHLQRVPCKTCTKIFDN